MKDRQSYLPNRRKITYVDGSVEYVTIEYADQPIEEGTMLSKATFLTDETVIAYGLDPDDDPLVTDILLRLATHAARHAVDGEDAITPASILASAKSSAPIAVTLDKDDWSGSNYVVTVAGLAANANVEIIPATTITSEQLTALQFANIIGTAQTSGNFTVTAYGLVPTLDIPVLLIVRGDYY